MDIKTTRWACEDVYLRLHNVAYIPGCDEQFLLLNAVADRGLPYRGSDKGIHVDEVDIHFTLALANMISLANYMQRQPPQWPMPHFQLVSVSFPFTPRKEIDVNAREVGP